MLFFVKKNCIIKYIITVKSGGPDMTDRERFISIYKEKIHREGASALLDYLTDKCDFFTAPASTRYHNSRPGGLVNHSLNVYDCLVDYLEREKVKNDYGCNPSEETIAIVALLHDICKVNFYPSVHEPNFQTRSSPCPVL